MHTDAVQVEVSAKTWPLAQPFVISRGAKIDAATVIVELRAGGVSGRGEAVPYARYGESVDGVIQSIKSVADEISRGLDRAELQRALPPGAARNALDLALWDLEAKEKNIPVWQLAGIAPLRPVVTAYTLSLDTPERMGISAAAHRHRPILKLKLTGIGDVDRVRAVRLAAPQAKLIVDANEGWSIDQMTSFAPLLAELGVALIEQPLASGSDNALATVPHAVPLCADESCHTTADLERLVGLYECVNIKLDKAGGLTEALQLIKAAQTLGFKVMVGCMVASSLAMAPALLLAQRADFVDLDGPLLLDHDCEHGLLFEGSLVHPSTGALWG
jgi:L-alanine-DL-glutamate epimerase-like enolase superfamily enzyme